MVLGKGPKVHVVNRRQPCQDQRAMIDYTQRLRITHQITPLTLYYQIWVSRITPNYFGSIQGIMALSSLPMSSI